MENIKFIKHKSDNESFEVFTFGYPDFEGMTEAQKRAFLLPLVPAIRKFYENPENERAFQTWKAAR